MSQKSLELKVPSVNELNEKLYEYQPFEISL